MTLVLPQSRALLIALFLAVRLEAVWLGVTRGFALPFAVLLTLVGSHVVRPSW